MGENVNRVVLTGNLTSDPEIRRTQSGTAVMNFSIAVNDRKKNQQTGEWEDYANFVDCTMFGSRAESLSKLLSKGKKVAVDGKLHYGSWEKEGRKRSKLDVTVESLELLSPREGGRRDDYYGDYSDAF